MTVKLYTNVTAVTVEDLSSSPGVAAKVLQTDAGGSVTLDHIHLTNDANVGASAKVGSGVTVGAYSTPSAGDVRASGGLAAGVDADPGDGNVEYAGSLMPYRNGATYAACSFVPLSSPLTSASWDGDAYSTAGKTTIDLSAVFGAPAGIKAVLVRVLARDSASAASTGGLGILLSPNSTASQGPLHTRCDGRPNDVWEDGGGQVPCDANGDIYYQTYASGAATLDVHLQIWGYWI